jgi:Concanavalin A-like lectin/glucanases superfamily
MKTLRLIFAAVIFLCGFFLLSITTSRTQEPIPCSPAPSGLIGWWPGDGDANDIQGGNNGALQGGTTFAPGEVGQAFSFHDAGDYVSVANAPGLQLQSFTIDAWVSGGGGPIFAYGNGGYGLVMGGDGRLTLTQVGSSNVQSTVKATPGTGFHHVAVTKNGSAVIFYVDGVADAPVSYNPLFSFNSNAAIGSYGNYFLEYFNGLIDEIEVANRALSQSEIQAIYSADTAGKCAPQCISPSSGLVSWWPANGNPGDVAGSCSGTLQGNASFAPGIAGQAFSFDGSVNSFVEIPDSPLFNPTGAFSVGGWFYIDPAAPGNAGEMASFVSKSNGNSPEGGWFLVFDSRISEGFSNAVRFTVMNGGFIDAVLQNAITSAGWYHLVGTFDPSAFPQAILFMNGAQVATSSGSIPSVGANAFSLRIGAMHWSESFGLGNDRLNGKADEVQFFNRALTAEEIAAVYNAGSAGICIPCVRRHRT